MTAALWIILWCSLLYGCITDIKSQLVYNFTWWFGGLAAGGLLWESLCAGQAAAVLGHLTVYMALQLGLFARMYGRADCYAFCVCAIAEASLGKGFSDHLVLMLLALFLLFPVQLLRRNIARNGNLKRPVAFLPYIATAFALHMIIAVQP
ncbi:MAG: hypothetical protein K2O97_05510 [Acetatifactor sp.]|nr:hypothetical protein [Acetatifactor sp.]